MFKNLWCKHGCPEKMTIHVKSTGETITLINGLPVRDEALKNPVLMRFATSQNPKARVTQPVRDNRVCLACQKGFYSKREDAKYCSARCQKRVRREQEALRIRAERERLLAAS